MKKAAFFIALLTFSIHSYSQDIRYVRDTIYVSLRSNPSLEADIIQSRIVSGSTLILIRSSDDQAYSLVKTTNGAEGWLQSQYLSKVPTAKQKLQDIQQELTKVTKQRDLLQDKINNQEDSIQLALSHNSVEPMAVSAPNTFTEITQNKKVVSQSLATDNRHQNLLLENQQLSNQLQVASIENEFLHDKITNNNFLNGAFAVLIGVFITLLVPRLRLTKRSEWK